MTLTQFTRDVIPIIQGVLTLLGLASLALVWWQIRESRRWNQLNAVVALTKLDVIAKTEQAVTSSFAAVGVDLSTINRPLTAEEVTKVRTNDKAIAAASDHLSDLENLGIALAAGVADDTYARAIHGPRIAHAWHVLEPLIIAIRLDAGGGSVFAEIERTALRWKEQELLSEIHRAKEDAKRQKRIQRLQRRIDKLTKKRDRIRKTHEPPNS